MPGGITPGLCPFVITILLVGSITGLFSPVHSEVGSRSMFEYEDLFLYQLPCVLEETS